MNYSKEQVLEILKRDIDTLSRIVRFRYEFFTNPDNKSETLLIEVSTSDNDLVDRSIDDIQVTVWNGDESELIIYACEMEKKIIIKILIFANVSEEVIKGFIS
jgi:hypothetical protein